MKTKATVTAPTLPAPASRIGIVCGPGQWPKDNAGTVLCHVENRWGKHAVCMMDSGKIHHCHGLTKVGIGTHQL